MIKKKRCKNCNTILYKNAKKCYKCGYLMVKSGIFSKLWKCKKLTKNVLKYLYIKKDLSANQIGKKYHLCDESIRKRLIRFNIKRKPLGSPKGKKHWLWAGGDIKIKCDICKKSIFIRPYEKKFKHHYCSRKCAWRGMSIFNSGKNSKLYLKYLDRNYPKQFNNYIKEQIRRRDNYICQICKKEGNYIHHIDYNKYNIDPKNLVTLCLRCHTKTTFKFTRIAWTNYFKNKRYKYQNNPLIILVAGSFDMLHMGHINIIKKSKNLGDYLIVSVSSGNLIKSYKNNLPIISLRDRINAIKSLKYVDKVVKQTKLVDIKQFKKLKADIFVLGDDWKNNYTNKGINWLRKNNKIIFLPYTKHLSSSKIKEKIIRNAVQIIQAQSKRK
jgi:glycerol-3-phosphate cytidylyltransferase